MALSLTKTVVLPFTSWYTTHLTLAIVQQLHIRTLTPPTSYDYWAYLWVAPRRPLIDCLVFFASSINEWYYGDGVQGHIVVASSF